MAAPRKERGHCRFPFSQWEKGEPAHRSAQRGGSRAGDEGRVSPTASRPEAESRRLPTQMFRRHRAQRRTFRTRSAPPPAQIRARAIPPMRYWLMKRAFPGRPPARQGVAAGPIAARQPVARPISGARAPASADDVNAVFGFAGLRTLSPSSRAALAGEGFRPARQSRRAPAVVVAPRRPLSLAFAGFPAYIRAHFSRRRGVVGGDIPVRSVPRALRPLTACARFDRKKDNDHNGYA